MARFTPTTILSTYGATSALNANFSSIATLFEQVLFRDGTATNTVTANLDLNNFKIQNLADGVDNSDAINLGQATDLINTTLTDLELPSFTVGTVTDIAPGGTPTFTISGTYPNLTIDVGLVRGDTGSGSSVAWGDITGTLSNQSDLNTAINAKAALASPTFTGTPAAPTAAPGTNTTQIATTAFVTAAITANNTNTALLGTPTAPTAAAGTATTQIATTAFVDALRDVTQNAQTGAYALVLTDRNKHISNTTGGFTIPANASVAFPVGTLITLFNNSASTQTVAITTDTLRQAGTTNTGSRTIAAYGLASLLKVGTTTWVISGNIT